MVRASLLAAAISAAALIVIMRSPASFAQSHLVVAAYSFAAALVFGLTAWLNPLGSVIEVWEVGRKAGEKAAEAQQRGGADLERWRLENPQADPRSWRFWFFVLAMCSATWATFVTERKDMLSTWTSFPLFAWMLLRCAEGALVWLRGRPKGGDAAAALGSESAAKAAPGGAGNEATRAASGSKKRRNKK